MRGSYTVEVVRMVARKGAKAVRKGALYASGALAGMGREGSRALPVFRV